MPTLEQIQAKLKKLQAQADALVARKAQVAVDQIRELMLKHGLTTEDIERKAKAKRVAKALNSHAASSKAKAAGAVGKKLAKYRDPKTGSTWTGHGRAPAWIANVKDRTQFLVDSASEPKSAATAVVTRAKTGRKGQPKGAQPPKYRDPKTGATWSGRGPAPAWLAAAKDRTRFLIDSAAAVASGAAQKAATKAVTKAGKPKSAATSGAVSKKSAAKKVVAAKKAAGSKAAAKKATAVSRKTAASKSAATPAVKKAASTRTAAKKAPGRKAGSKGQAGAASTASAAAPQTSAEQPSA